MSGATNPLVSHQESLKTGALAAAERTSWLLRGWLFVLSLGSAQTVAASELILEWSAPPQCPDQSAITARVETILGEDARANLTATVVVKQGASGFQARIRVASSAGLGMRMLEGTSCDTLSEDVALVIALSASHSTSKPMAAARSTEATEEELALTLGVHAAAGAGPLPRPAFGFGGAVALEGLAALRMELACTYYTPQAVTFDGQPTVGAELTLLRAGLRVCRLWNLGPLDLGGCVGGQLYRLSGEGFGSAVASRTGAAIFGGPSLGFFSRLQLLDRFALLFAADGGVQTSRDRFVFGVFGLLHQPSRFALQLVVASEVRL